jgi:ribosomal protein L24
MNLKPTDRVRILEGPFADFRGEVAEVRTSPERLVVVVGVLGKTTSVELLPSQVEPADSGGDNDAAAPVCSPRKPTLTGAARASAERSP